MAHLPPVSILFAAFLGYNPIQHLLGPAALHALSAHDQAALTGPSFFPNLISGPFRDGLHAAFAFAIVACLVAAGGVAHARRAEHVDRPRRTWLRCPSSAAGADRPVADSARATGVSSRAAAGMQSDMASAWSPCQLRRMCWVAGEVRGLVRIRDEIIELLLARTVLHIHRRLPVCTPQ